MPPLHDLLSDANERAAHAQEESQDLIERQRAVVATLEETMEQVRERRRVARRSETDNAVPGGAPGRGRAYGR